MSLLLCFYTMQSHDEVGISNLRQNLLIRLINQVSCRDCRFGIHPITERVYIWDPPYVCISASERRTPPTWDGDDSRARTQQKGDHTARSKNIIICLGVASPSSVLQNKMLLLVFFSGGLLFGIHRAMGGGRMLGFLENMRFLLVFSCCPKKRKRNVIQTGV